jgi:predicted nuclease of predicted toxin-antitoxin system
MKFLVDAQLPPALARWLSASGHDASHVADLGMKTAKDHIIWNEVSEKSVVLITKDDDFIELARIKPGPKIIWVRIGNSTRKHLLEKFEKALPALEAALQQGDVLVELR